MRTQEIAIRIAMGAQRTDIAALVFRTGFGLAALGCLLGASLSVIVVHLIRSFLFEVSATDPLIYIWSIAIMILMTLLASAIPANRAT
jgi:ABC-type antimicrobial peptide transport system permease subunit